MLPNTLQEELVNLSLSEEEVSQDYKKELEGLDKLSGTSLNERYGLSSRDPHEAFKVFHYRFGVAYKWVQYKAWQVSVQKGIEQEEVEQHLWYKAWLAAIDHRYDPECGKSIIGWIHQRVMWSFINLMKARNPVRLLEDYRTETSYLEPEDKFVYEAASEDFTEVMGGSYSLSRRHKRLEAKNLIDRILKVVEKLPYDYRSPIVELLNPSDHFLQFAQEEETNDKYDGAARFEICSSHALFGFTGSTAYNLKVAVEFLCKEIPELRELKF